MTVRRKLVGVHKKGSGALMETNSELVDAKGNVYYKFQSAGFVIGAYGFTDAGITIATLFLCLLTIFLLLVSKSIKCRVSPRYVFLFLLFLTLLLPP